MPPIRKTTKAKAKTSRGKATGDHNKARAAARKARLRNYNNQIRSQAINSNRLLGIKTLLPKELNVSIQYRELLTFTTSGHSTAGGGMYSPLLVRINMLDPCVATSANSGGIITIINYGGSSVPPLYHRLNPEANLQSKLQDYADKYDCAVITGSQAKVRVQGVANQHKLTPFFQNVAGQGNPDGGYGSNFPPHLYSAQPTLDGELYVWSVKQRSVGQLVANNNGLNLMEIRTKVPGMKMKKHNCYTNGTTSKAVIHTSKYSPKFLGLKDWRDNIERIEFNVDGESRSGFAENCFQYVGITNRVPSSAALEPARVFMDVVVNYNVRFLQRKNDPSAGDDPLAHARHTEF